MFATRALNLSLIATLAAATALTGCSTTSEGYTQTTGNASFTVQYAPNEGAQPAIADWNGEVVCTRLVNEETSEISDVYVSDPNGKADADRVSIQANETRGITHISVPLEGNVFFASMSDYPEAYVDSVNSPNLRITEFEGYVADENAEPGNKNHRDATLVEVDEEGIITTKER